MDHTRSSTTLGFYLTVIVLSIIAVFLLISKCRSDASTAEKASDSQSVGSGSETMNDSADSSLKGADTRFSATPEKLVGKISDVVIKANATGDVQPLIDLLGKNNLNSKQQELLLKLAASSKLSLSKSEPFSASQKNSNQWSLNLFDNSRILLDLQQDDSGNWQIKNVTLPEIEVSPTKQNLIRDNSQADISHSAEQTAQAFIDAILQLDPTAARKYVDSDQISYAKIAALCIIFEEGNYKLSQHRPLRKMFLRENTAGWLAQAHTTTDSKTANFALNTKRENNSTPWQITEINLDKLLADYAEKFAGGDIHYTPLVQNPKGGDSLAIYFKLDSQTLTPRTQQQLSIISQILKSDPNKKLTISGHTDALGSDNYNLNLSNQRAQQVMKFFINKGIPTSQIKTIGFGKTKPRRPNLTDNGSDNPDGRRANRRAEILLNF